MFGYIIRRLLILPVLALAVSMLIFTMLSMLTPYERASLYVQDIAKRPGAIDAIIEKYGLDDPIPVQYWHWMVGRKDKLTGEIEGGILRGSLGWSKVGKGFALRHGLVRGKFWADPGGKIAFLVEISLAFRGNANQAPRTIASLVDGVVIDIGAMLVGFE